MQTGKEKELNTDPYLRLWWKSMQIHCLGVINNTKRRISKLLSNLERCPASLHSGLVALWATIVCLNKAVSLGPDPVMTVSSEYDCGYHILIQGWEMSKRCWIGTACKDNLTFSLVFPSTLPHFEVPFQPFSVHHNSVAPFNIIFNLIMTVNGG